MSRGIRELNRLAKDRARVKVDKVLGDLEYDLGVTDTSELGLQIAGWVRIVRKKAEQMLTNAPPKRLRAGPAKRDN